MLENTTDIYIYCYNRTVDIDVVFALHIEWHNFIHSLNLQVSQRKCRV